VEARQLLRAAQVGALPDARLEINVYELLLRRRMDPGPWIGESLVLGEGEVVGSTTIEELLQRPSRRLFREVPRSQSGGFLKVHAAHFEERDAEDRLLRRRPLEFVIPSRMSCNTLCMALLRRMNGRVFIGLDDHDLPAAQCFTGNSDIWVSPAWRLPLHVRGRALSSTWVRGRIEADYGIICGKIWELGGRFYPSVGVTPEVVHALAIEVLSGDGVRQGLRWVALEDVLMHRAGLPDGHLRVVVLRAAHALGLMKFELEDK
jgi:hypothetical protein